MPAMPGNGPFFTSELKSGQICFTGGATGTMKPIEVCSCSMAFNAYKEALANASAASSKHFPATPQSADSPFQIGV